MRSILVTRPQPAADEFAEKLRQEGFDVYVAPLMEYVEMEAAMEDLAHFQGCVFTSARAVQIFAARTSHRDLPVLAVGEATAATALGLGFAHIHSADGDSQDVIALLRDCAEKLSLKHILHPCSDDTPDDIPRAAAEFGVTVSPRIVYKAVMIRRLPNDVTQALRHHRIDAVTLFSARAATNFCGIMKRREMKGVSANMEAVCISERVAAELYDTRLKGVRVAGKPNTLSLIAAMKGAPEDSAFSNRRQKTDRRQAAAPRDDQGNIRAGTYTGPDRRSGIDRRAYYKRQQEIIMHEKMAFLNRVILTGAFILLAIFMAGLFLMGPEYLRLKNVWQRDGGVGVEMPALPGNFKNFSLGGFINHQIENFGGVARNVGSAVRKMAAANSDILRHEGLPGLVRAIGQMQDLRGTDTGSMAVNQAMGRLRHLLAQNASDPAAASAALMAARQQDGTLDSLLNAVGWKDVAAAGMLLTLSEFRNNVDGNRPFAQDLTLLQKYAGNDPEMNAALQRLSPYAKRGIKGRKMLEKEFQGFARDIVMAAVQGRDISIQAAALQHMDNLSRAVKAGDIEGQGPEAITARARLLMQQGDVKGAVQELQALDGPAAAAAEPWMDSAADYVIADQSSDTLARGILSVMAEGSSGMIDNIVSSIKTAVMRNDVVYMSPALKGGGGGYEGLVAGPRR